MRCVLQALLADRARYLNTALFIRLTPRVAAVVLVTVLFLDAVTPRWAAVLAAVGTMAVVSYVVIGVGPRTLGRQQSDRVALAAAEPVALVTRVLGPLSSLLILIGNALTPGRGFRQGPFASEAELREMVDMAEASMLIEADERRIVRSVFELGDTLTREVMVPRTDMIFIEHDKTLRQCLSLALRSGFGRRPGDRGRHRRRRRGGLPQGRRPPRLRQPQRRDDRADRFGDANAYLRAGLQAGRRPAARDAGGANPRRCRHRRVRRDGRAGDDRGRAGRDRRRDRRRVRQHRHRGGEAVGRHRCGSAAG